MVIIQFLENLLSWLELRDPPENIDAQLFEEVRHICSQFQEKYPRYVSAFMKWYWYFSAPTLISCRVFECDL